MTLYKGTRWKVLVVFAVAWFALNVATDANAHVYGTNAKQYQYAMDEALVPHVGHVQVTHTPPKGCENSLGCTRRGSLLVYVNPDQSPLQQHITFMHEVAHQWDFRVMDNTDRINLKVAMGWDAGMYWWQIFGNGSDTPGEVYAEASAWCAIGLRPKHYTATSYGWHPTEVEHEAVCAAILRTDD